MYKKYALALITFAMVAQQATANTAYNTAISVAKKCAYVGAGAAVVAGLGHIGMNTTLNPFAALNDGYSQPIITSKEGYLNNALYIATSPVYGLAQLSKPAATILKSILPDNKLTNWHDGLTEEAQDNVAKKTAYTCVATLGLGVLCIAAKYWRN
jgi:hypothetical protein